MTGHRVLQGCTREQVDRATRALFCIEQTHLSEYGEGR